MARSDPSLRSRLTRAGFYEVDKAERFYEALSEEPAIGRVDLEQFARAASPDDALLGLLRLAEAVRAADSAGEPAADETASDPETGVDELAGTWANDPALARRLIAALGVSTGLVDHVVRHPADWRLLVGDEETLLLGREESSTEAVRAALLESVGADPAGDVPVATCTGEDAWTRLRRRYRQLLLQLVADDASSAQPTSIVPEVARILADMAAAALEASLAVARADTDGHEAVRLGVVGMGKTGGRELNYVSDVDVIYIAEPADDSVSEDAVRDIGTRLATQLASGCAAPSTEPALWAVDAALRPEGKNGQLVRTIAEHRHYYDAWAKSWEFQALLKARPVAGDLELGNAYYDALNPLVWEASRRDGFVESVRAMRTRVTDNIPDRDVPQQLKLGPGGLRDVEFSAQLLQMVHGSADVSLRTPNTWEALEALKAGGYIGRDDAAELDAGYRFLRVIEHRLQLSRLRRTHLVPTDPHALRSLARGVYPLGVEGRTGDRLESSRKELGRRIRILHKQIFYRPVLALSAQLSGGEATLTTNEAKDRLAAVGYVDPDGALRHLQALSSGVSRRAAIQRQLLPVLLEWLSDGVDPDAGLLAFRKVSESLGTSHWYLRLLRDSGVAAERLTTLLGVSRKISELLLDRPAAVAWLDGSKNLGPADRRSIAAEATRTAGRHSSREDAIAAIRSIYTRELLRVAIRDVLAFAGPRDVATELSMLTEACLDVALQTVRRFAGDPPSDDFRFTIVAMGRLGGAEIGYDSDADIIFIFDPGGATASAATKYATTLASELSSVLRAPTGNAAIDVDASLRPEGKSGPLTRSLASYASYYRQWSQPWEAQALLRARTIGGDFDLGAEYELLIEPLRYPASMPEEAVRQVRRLKARMESERLPKGAEPTRHLKLGRGGLSDVEWVAQLLQLEYAHVVPALRTTSTIGALEAARDAQLISADDVHELAESWTLAGRVRNAMVLWRGRTAASLPTEGRDLEAVARLLGYPAGSGHTVEDDYLRAARHARRVMERVFYG